MEYAPTSLLIPLPLPQSPPSSNSIDLSPLEFVLGLIAVITIPVLIYTIIFAIKCSSSVAPFSRGRGRRRSFSGEIGPGFPAEPAPPPAVLKPKKEAEGECPVCLSAFGEGEEVKQLSACNHYFHAPCIDAWLISHANCPVCRASIPVKRPPPTSHPRPAGDSDHLHGLPDSASLV